MAWSGGNGNGVVAWSSGNGNGNGVVAWSSGNGNGNGVVAWSGGNGNGVVVRWPGQVGMGVQCIPVRPSRVWCY